MDRTDRVSPDVDAALAALPRESAPHPGEEERTVRALRRRGLLPAPRWQRYATFGAAAAAAVVVFVAGSVYGASRAHGVGASAEPDRRVSDARAAALRVQRAGSEYVTALVRFAALARTTPADAALAGGREAAATTLCAAAAQLPRITPDVHRAASLCDGADAAAPAREKLYWF